MAKKEKMTPVSDQNPSQETQTSPEWHPPAIPPDYLYLPLIPPTENFQIETKDISQPMITSRRDTIDNIAVRVPGEIRIDIKKIPPHERKIEDEAFYAISYTSTNRYIEVNFDNDIFNNTDYYYTNGIRIDYVAPIFASSPLSLSMLPFRKHSMNYHGMTIVQNMYTPTNPDVTHVLDADRPFAAYLYLGHFKNTLSNDHQYRQYSELDIGLIGPGSLGGLVQGQIHNIEPVGWQNQIQNDIVLNYTATVEKGLYNPGLFDLNVFATGQIGTLYDNAGGGLRIRAGRLNPYFKMPRLATEQSTEGKKAYQWQYGIFASAKAKVVLYNATLQGGIFNKTNNYSIPAEDIERFLLEASAGIYVAYKQLGLTLEQFYLSPEFKNAHHFRWGHVNVSYCF
jgi:hypothetical protein